MIYFVSSGPGQYDIRMESRPQMALITSRADRFKVPTDASPGPGAYQVREILESLSNYANRHFKICPPSLTD